MRKTGDIIRAFRAREGLTGQELGDKIGVSQAFIHLMESDKRRVPQKTMEILKLMLSREDYLDILKYEEYATTPDFIKNELKRISNFSKEDIISEFEMREYPIYESVSAGFGIIPDAAPIEYISLPILRGEIVGIYVVGNSMEPSISDGDIILVKKDIEVQVGEIGVFVNQVTGEGFVKRLKYKNGCYILKSDNPMYTDVEIQSDDIICCGKVARIIKRARNKPEPKLDLSDLTEENKKRVEDFINILKLSQK